MGYHGVHLLRCAVKLDSLTKMFVAAGGAFFLFIWLLCGIILGLFREYFELLCRMPGAMHQACVCTVWQIVWMACIICIVIASAALLRVSW